MGNQRQCTGRRTSLASLCSILLCSSLFLCLRVRVRVRVRIGDKSHLPHDENGITLEGKVVSRRGFLQRVPEVLSYPWICGTSLCDSRLKGYGRSNFPIQSLWKLKNALPPMVVICTQRNRTLDLIEITSNGPTKLFYLN